ncbi:MAG: hypothetical protein ACRD3J_15720, partial [Thermoanaerobaculia bacterium]
MLSVVAVVLVTSAISVYGQDCSQFHFDTSIIWTTCGRVGIGINPPQRGLDIYSSDSNEALRLQNTLVNSYTQMSFKGTGRQWQIGAGNGSAGAGAVNSFFIYDASGGGFRFVIDTLGHVGIGTPPGNVAFAPQRTLDVYASDSNETLRLQNTLETGYTQMAFKGTARQWQVGVGNGSAMDAFKNKFFVYDATANSGNGAIRF